MLESLLIVTYIVEAVLFYWLWKTRKEVIREVVYVPMLDKELADENKTLQSKLFSSDVRLEKMKTSYETELQKNKELQKILDDIYKAQNKYKEIK